MRIKRLFIWTIAVSLFFGLAYLFGYSKLLVVKQIEIKGVSDLTSISSVINKKALHLKEGEQLARVDIKGSEREFRNLGWISSVKVRRNWLNRTVAIDINPRIPLAQVSGPDMAANSFIDKTGTIFAPPIGPQDLPSISLANPSLSSVASVFISEIPNDLLKIMKGLRIDSSGSAKMEISVGKKGLTINWGNSHQIALKIAIYNRLIALPENQNISKIDLENPANPVVKQ